MLNQLHSSHIGIGGCVRRAREILCWPRMSTGIRVSHCTICQAFCPAQARVELQPNELPLLPWQKIAADLFVIGQQTFLITEDYWSNFFEVVEIHRKTAQAVITRFNLYFARHGIPQVLISDNCLKFDNKDFKNLSTYWQFEHRTSLKSEISTSERKSRKCCENLQRTALEGRQPRPIIGDPCLVQHPK